MKNEFNFETHPWESFLFLDIETVARVPELEEDTPLYDSFVYKMRYAEEAQRKDFNSYNVKALYQSKAALYPEFGKIVAITVGKIIDEKLVVHTFKGHDEKDILFKFMQALANWVASDPNLAICGANIKFFDLRFLYIRSIINQIKPVKGHINLTGLKPWEVRAADINEYWKQTSMYNAPLACMTESLGLPTPKSDIDGSQVSETYWKEGDAGLERIVKYCERDVLAVANIARMLRFAPILELGGMPKKESKGKEEAPAIETELPPLFVRSMNMKEITEEDEKDILNRVKRSSKVERERLISIIRAVSGKTEVDEAFIQAILTNK